MRPSRPLQNMEGQGEKERGCKAEAWWREEMAAHRYGVCTGMGFYGHRIQVEVA